MPQIGAPETTKAKIVIVDRPGAQQTMVRLLQLGVDRATPDYPALEVMNSELGGLFSSRINLNLREEHGYTYGASSFFVYRRTLGYFGAGGGIRTDATAPAVTEMLKEIHRMIDTPMKPEELSLAKDSQSRSLPGMFETSSGAAGALSEISVYNLPRDYFAKLPDRLNAVTAEDAEAVAKKYLHPDQMILVCVGDRAKIEPELEKLDLGAIEIRDADGNVVNVGRASACLLSGKYRRHKIKPGQAEARSYFLAGDALRTKFTISCVDVPGRNISAMPACFRAGNIGFRNRPAQQHGHIAHPFLLEQIHQLRCECIVRARKNRQPDHVDIFLHCGGRDHLRRLPQPGVNHFHPGVAQGAGNNLRPAVVAVKPRLGNQHPYSLLRHFSLVLFVTSYVLPTR